LSTRKQLFGHINMSIWCSPSLCFLTPLCTMQVKMYYQESIVLLFRFAISTRPD